MRSPAILLVLSVLLFVASWLPDLPVHADLAPIAVLSALAAGLLVLRSWLRMPKPRIVVDGSNVLYWADKKPDLANVLAVITSLRGRGFAPVVWFDANAGHLVAGRYLNARQLALRLGLPEDQVHVAKSGMPADPQILSMAIKGGLRIVTNDRYRDWVDRFPRLMAPGLLVQGRVSAGRVELMFPIANADAVSPRRAAPAARPSSGPSPAAPLPRPRRPQTVAQADRRPRPVPQPPAA